MKRTNAHWDDDLYSAGRDDLSIIWFRAISPKSNPVIRVAVRGTSVVTIIGTIIHHSCREKNIASPLLI
jgi:hypothetical protein